MGCCAASSRQMAACDAGAAAPEKPRQIAERQDTRPSLDREIHLMPAARARSHPSPQRASRAPISPAQNHLLRITSSRPRERHASAGPSAHLPPPILHLPYSPLHFLGKFVAFCKTPISLTATRTPNTTAAETIRPTTNTKELGSQQTAALGCSQVSYYDGLAVSEK
jgi:hypothetical protein